MLHWANVSQLYVTPKDRNFLRFLWFENIDLTNPIFEYQMNVHLFEAASSPGVANSAYIKQQKLTERGWETTLQTFS